MEVEGCKDKAPLSPPTGEEICEIDAEIMFFFFEPGFGYAIKLHWRRTHVQLNFN